MSHSHTSLAPQLETGWRSTLYATGLCLALLLVALAASPFSAPLSTIILIIAFAVGAWHPLKETVPELLHGHFDIDFLMLLVAAGAMFLGHPLEGVLLLVLFGASRTMESYVRGRTRSALEMLSRDLPSTALRIDATSKAEESVPVAELVPQDRVLARAGDRIPVDCVIEEGTSLLDCSALTGEAEPVTAVAGVEAPSGAVNGQGRLVLRVLRPASESAWQKIVTLVENAPERRAPQQELADRVGRVYTAIILLASVAGFLMWWLFVGLSVSDAAYRAMVLLVAGSPCALVLSLPSAVLAGIANGARRGILFHGGRGLLALEKVVTIAFDKTGTLTTGEPRVAGAEASENAAVKDIDVYAWALALASSSTHPASRAVATHIKRERPETPTIALEPDSLREVPGTGVQARIAGRTVVLGRPKNGHGERSGVALNVDGNEILRFELEESLRPTAIAMIRSLHTSKIKTVILSGDRQAAVDAMAKRLSIDTALGGLLPEDKHRWITDAAGKAPVALVGDGMNDVPAMTAATVAVAMGVRGSAAALSQADIILVGDRLEAVPEAVALAKRTRMILTQNLAIAVGAAAILVAFSLYGNLPLVLGVFGHEGGTVLVLLNSLRLLLTPSPGGPTTGGWFTMLRQQFQPIAVSK